MLKRELTWKAHCYVQNEGNEEFEKTSYFFSV